ncbi:hypothetical protein PPACK8108_LOCUS20980 [Phakopsora pachyrhizi]|uniref:Uncharacterized protein n=1 Tax=Phakopsora pachyrhizi TaxID=170000 RepID=A0AAV0BI57_PHAPC|nr:hypothetical protein PPACK8108_LOCUS20980 [Phakopsora pachyrhizi]
MTVFIVIQGTLKKIIEKKSVDQNPGFFVFLFFVFFSVFFYIYSFVYFLLLVNFFAGDWCPPLFFMCIQVLLLVFFFLKKKKNTDFMESVQKLS